MRNSYSAKLAVVLAIGGLCSVLAACGSNATYSESGSTNSTSGLEALSNSEYAKARDVFADEYKNDPNDLYALHNLATTYLYMGNRAEAVPLYHRLAAAGHDQRPEHVYEMKGNPTFTEVACFHLNELHVQDANCSA